MKISKMPNQDNDNRANALKGILLIGILVFSIISYNYFVFGSYVRPYNVKGPTISGLQGTLVIYKNGTQVIKEPDLLTTNFFIWFDTVMNGDVSLATSALANGCPTNAALPSADLPYISVSSGAASCATVGNSGGAPYIGIGNGASTPAITDTALSSKIATAQGILTYSNTAPQIIISATFTASAAQTVQEAGLYTYVFCAQPNAGYNALVLNSANCYYNGASPSNAAPILIAHDSFTGISMNSGDTLTVSYQFTIPPCNPTNNSGFSCSQIVLGVLLAQALAHSCSYSGAPYCIQQSSTARYFVDGNVVATNALLSAQAPSNGGSVGINPPVYVSYASTKVSITAQANGAVNNAQQFTYQLCIASGGCYSVATIVVGSGSGVNLVAGQPYGIQFTS